MLRTAVFFNLSAIKVKYFKFGAMTNKVNTSI